MLKEFAWKTEEDGRKYLDCRLISNPDGTYAIESLIEPGQKEQFDSVEDATAKIEQALHQVRD